MPYKNLEESRAFHRDRRLCCRPLGLCVSCNKPAPLHPEGRGIAAERLPHEGADDYVVKPFSPTELLARIKAALHKREAPEWAEPSEPFVLGELTIDYASVA